MSRRDPRQTARVVAREDWREKEKKKKASHKLRLEKEFGIVDHPKSDKLYEIAWSFGHSEGFNEVESYYLDMVELLK